MSSIGSVLVIDDEPILRNTLTRILRQAGCDVTSAGEGAEALRRLTDGVYELVFLDLRLPDFDGLQILKAIRESTPTLPVILLTAHGSLSTALEALRLGASDYLLKPIDPEILVARTRVILQEQAVEKRRREINDQIAALQQELRRLDAGQYTPGSNVSSLLTQSPEDRFLKRNELILDLQAQRATFGNQVITLPPTTFDYLVVLARHSPDVVEYKALVAEAQGYQADHLEAKELSKWHIHVIRQALETGSGKPRFVLNVRGVGYRLLIEKSGSERNAQV